MRIMHNSVPKACNTLSKISHDAIVLHLAVGIVHVHAILIAGVDRAYNKSPVLRAHREEHTRWGMEEGTA